MSEHLELAEPTIIGSGNSLLAVHGTDASLRVEFDLQDVKNAVKSLKAGHPVFDQVQMITIKIPGNNKTVVVRKVRHDIGPANEPPDPVRWPKQWQAFQNKGVQSVDGMPLEQWAPLVKNDVQRLKGLNIHSVEQLASVGDHNLHNLGHGGRGLRDTAKAWLEQAGAHAKDSSIAQELAAAKNTSAVLQEQLDAMKAQMQAMADRQLAAGSPPKNKGGRPRKIVTQPIPQEG